MSPTLMPHFCLGVSSHTSLLCGLHLGPAPPPLLVTTAHLSRGTMRHSSRDTGLHDGTWRENIKISKWELRRGKYLGTYK